MVGRRERREKELLLTSGRKKKLEWCWLGWGPQRKTGEKEEGKSSSLQRKDRPPFGALPNEKKGGE